MSFVRQRVAKARQRFGGVVKAADSYTMSLSSLPFNAFVASISTMSAGAATLSRFRNQYWT